MYHDAKELNQKIGKLSGHFSIEVKKKYYSQFNRSALSVGLNIAEAAGRYSDIEMCRHFDIALGSLAEVVACADHLKDKDILTIDRFSEIHNAAFHIAKQIQGMKH
ncbi:four helix bundle protein [Candidatus Peregrinibacteria bacterium]|nr:four helix bundle protein [Candidatus Peregrinibacteria bacterium]